MLLVLLGSVYDEWEQSTGRWSNGVSFFQLFVSHLSCTGTHLSILKLDQFSCYVFSF
jgi:hypothetical protein